jgi:carboxypeptidase PM20D1
MSASSPVSPSVQRLAEHLSQAVQFATVTYSDVAKVDLDPFTKFQDWVLATYPLAAQHLEPRRDGPWNLHFRWRGSDPSAEPLILMAHYDVVPPGDLGAWKHGPFSGQVADGEVWGRGTLDVKINLVTILDAVENALAESFIPTRDIWLCFGGDEEVGGTRGAGELGKKLAAAGVNNAWLVDEGGVIAQGVLSFVKAPVALVGVAEKGFVNLKITADGASGHASMPPQHTAAGVLAQALVKVEAHPFPLRLTKTMAGFLRGAAPLAPPAVATFLRSPQFWWPVLKGVLAADPKTAAMARTTQALTMLAASDKENVLPAEASAVVNVRILPGDSVAAVLAHYQALLKGTGCRVDLTTVNQRNEPLPESDTAGPGWDAVVAAVKESEPSAVPLPYLVTAGTDTRHYLGVAKNMYRIQALVLDSSQIALIHSANERVSIENLGRNLRFYEALIRG